MLKSAMASTASLTTHTAISATTPEPDWSETARFILTFSPGLAFISDNPLSMSKFNFLSSVLTEALAYPENMVGMSESV